MPELPEIETIKHELETYFLNKLLLNIELRREDIVYCCSPEIKLCDLQLKYLTNIKRHGKYLLFHFNNDLSLICHLRMTGKLLFLPALSISDRDTILQSKHTHILFQFSNGTLAYHDVRRFGGFVLCRTIDLYTSKKTMSHIAYDALDPRFSPEYLYREAKKHPKLSLKSLILDQSTVAGIGNIYADEALFRTKLKPHTQAKRINKKQATELHHNIISVLNESIANKGTTFSDYRLANNQEGNNKSNLFVYGRKNMPCKLCGTKLKAIKAAGRTTVYCPNCQDK